MKKKKPKFYLKKIRSKNQIDHQMKRHNQLSILISIIVFN